MMTAYLLHAGRGGFPRIKYDAECRFGGDDDLAEAPAAAAAAAGGMDAAPRNVKVGDYIPGADRVKKRVREEDTLHRYRRPARRTPSTVTGASLYKRTSGRARCTQARCLSPKAP